MIYLMPYKIPHKKSVVIVLSLLIGLSSAYFVGAKEERVYKYTKIISGDSDIKSNNLAHDASGNIYQVGTFSGTADFDPGSGTDNKTAAGSSSIFITKSDKKGNRDWTKVTQVSGTAYGEKIA